MTISQKSMTTAQRPEELHQLFMACINAHDLDALLALYEQDSTAADLAGHPLHGMDNLSAFLAGFLTVVKQIDGGTRKVLVAGDIALMSSTWRAVLAAQDGGTTVVTGTSAEIARCQPDGTWRFLIDDPQFGSISAQS